MSNLPTVVKYFDIATISSALFGERPIVSINKREELSIFLISALKASGVLALVNGTFIMLAYL